MTPVKRNIVANLAGRGWSVLLSFALIPFYIRYLGVEAYGLVGFYLTLTAIATVFDMGFGTTLTREFARLTGADGTSKATAQRMRDLLRTLELITLGIALSLALVILLLSPWIAGGWLRAETLDTGVLEQAVALMGVALAAQWPTAFYSGGLSGLQRQVALNAILAFGTTLRGLGAILVLAFVAADIRAFFVWQAIAFAVQAIVLAVWLWHRLPASGRRARFRGQSLREVGHFALGIWAITVLGVASSQADKLVLSTLLPLEQFGYYTLAGMIASVATLLVAPIFGAVLPRLSELVARDDAQAVSGLYHATAQLLSVATLPLAATLVLFAPEILSLWTRDAAVAEAAAPIVQVLGIAAAINALLNAPYALQLAHGWTRLGVVLGALNLLVALPVLWWGATQFGARGAAIGYTLVCALNLTVGMTFLHARYLRGEAMRWLMRDTLPAVAAAMLVAGVVRTALDRSASGLPSGLWLAAVIIGTLACAFAAAALSTRSTREYLLRIAASAAARRNA